MSKDAVDQWDTDANNNTDVGGNNIAEGCPPSSINNAIRTVMAQIKTWYANVVRLDADNEFTGENTFSPPIPLTSGGTGATTANGARAALELGALSLLGFGDLVYSGTSSSNATFPVATTLAVMNVTPDRAGLASVFLPSASAKEFSNAGPTQLSGIWRGRGAISGGTLMQRTV